MPILKNIIVLLILLHLINSQLIKPNSVYEDIIKSIFHYYQCDCVIIFYTPSNRISAEDVEAWTKLKELFIFLNKHFIQTTITDIPRFIKEDSTINSKIEKGLLVFLDDSEELKSQLMTHLAPLIDVSQPTWLFFFSDKTNIDHFFADFYIPFDCRFMISQKNIHDNNETITEVYRIDKYKQLIQNVFGIWSLDTGMQLPTHSLYERRKDLHGHTMRVAVLESTPCSLILADKKNKLKLGGIFGSVTDILQQRMNFTPAYSVVSDYGSRLDDGNWTGGVGNLVNNISDIFPTNLRMISARLEAIQFTAPLYFTRDSFYFKKPLSTLSWEIFLTPFDRIIWMIIPILIMITSLIIGIILLFYKTKNLQTQMKMQSLNATDIFLDVFGAFCNQGMPRSTINSVNIVQLTIHLTATIVLAAYSGILTSSLTIDTFVVPFSTMKGLIEDGSYRMGVLENSAYYDFFKNTTDKIMGEVFKKKILTEDALPSTFADGLARVCIEERYAFLSSDLPAARFRMRNCILLASEAVFVASIAIGLPCNSPFRGLIDYHIISLRDSGVLQKILDDWTKSPPTQQEEQAKTVEFHSILPLITLLIGNYSLSLLFLGAEKILYKKLVRQKEIAVWEKLNINIVKY